MSEIVYYNSPIGLLQIKNAADAIAEVIFADNPVSEKLPENDFLQKNKMPAIINQCIGQLDKYFAGELFEFNLKLAPDGTPFQLNVWSELVKIRYGRTESYLSLSKHIGNVKAIRAVGTANGRNRIAIIIPCHRVIGSNEDLVGYAGGLWRKQWLLAHESKYANGVQTLF